MGLCGQALVFPSLDIRTLTIWPAVILVVGLAAAALGLGIARRRTGGTRPAPPAMSEAEKLAWRMPPLALLKPVQWSPGLRLGMLGLRGYLVLSAVLLLVKAVRLGSG